MVGPPAYADSAVNPIWREGVLLPLYNAFVQAGASEAEKQRVIKETNEVYDRAFKEATPGGGGYVNEVSFGRAKPDPLASFNERGGSEEWLMSIGKYL